MLARIKWAFIVGNEQIEGPVEMSRALDGGPHCPMSRVKFRGQGPHM